MVKRHSVGQDLGRYQWSQSVPGEPDASGGQKTAWDHRYLSARATGTSTGSLQISVLCYRRGFAGVGRYRWLDEDYVERPGRDRLGMMNMMVIFASPTCTSVGLLVDKDDLIKYQLFISYGLLVRIFTQLSTNC
jgi:hypothetical protein